MVENVAEHPTPEVMGKQLPENVQKKNKKQRGEGKSQKSEDELSDDRYRKNRPHILSRRLMSRVRTGSIPWRSTVKKYEADPSELFQLWTRCVTPEYDPVRFEKGKRRFAKMGASVE